MYTYTILATGLVRFRVSG